MAKTEGECEKKRAEEIRHTQPSHTATKNTANYLDIEQDCQRYSIIIFFVSSGRRPNLIISERYLYYRYQYTWYDTAQTISVITISARQLRWDKRISVTHRRSS